MKNRINVNDEYDFIIESLKDEIIVNGEKTDFDFKRINDSIYHIIHNHKSYRVDILSFDSENKKFRIKVNERDYNVILKDENDLLLEKIGIQNVSETNPSCLKAPMPGLILEIKVKEGQKVKIGDPLVVLKAMKMENVLKSTHQGTVKQIMVEENQKIEKDALILQF